MRYTKIRERDGRLDSHVHTLCNKAHLTVDQEQALGRKIANGDMAAADELLEHNFRFVLRWAVSLAGHGIDVDEAVSAACHGALLASRRFKPGRGKFITYAVHYIHRYLQTEQQTMSKPVRLPTNMSGMMNQVKKFRVEFVKENMHPPSAKDFEAALGSKAMAEAACVYFSASQSLDEPIDDRPKSLTRGELLRCNEMRPDAVAERKNSVAHIKKVMSKVLTSRETDVVSLRLGLADDIQWTLVSIGAKYGLTRERARQIYEQSIWKVRVAMGTTKRRDVPKWMSDQQARGRRSNG